MPRLSKREVDHLTDVFLGALAESGMSVPRDAAAEMVLGLARQGHPMTEESVMELALQLLSERVAEKPGSNVEADPDTADLQVGEVGRLVQALGVAGSVIREGDPIVDSLRRHALGHVATYGHLLQNRDRTGRIAVPRSLLHRTSHTLRVLANRVDEGADLEEYDNPIREGLADQFRADAALAEALTTGPQ